MSSHVYKTFPFWAGLIVGGAAGVVANYQIVPVTGYSGSSARIVEEVANQETGEITARVVSSAPFDCNTTVYVHKVPSLPYGTALLECRDGKWQVSRSKVQQ